MRKINNKTALTFFVNATIILIIVFVGAVSFYPSSNMAITGNEYAPIYNGNKSKPYVSLMFNVYQNTDNVYKIMDILDKHEAKATFFVGGCWADDNTECLKEIVGRGFEIANHGYFHEDHKKLSLEKNKEEIELCERIVYALCGAKTALFAPPSGAFNSTTLKAAAELNYKFIMWSKDTIDWRDKDVALIYKRATKDIENGDLILMHPMAVTVNALDDILKYYESVGLKSVTVSQNIEE